MSVQSFTLRTFAALLVACNCALPAQARFLETDPVGYVDSMNLYGYVGSDPLNKTDPTGRQEFEAFATDAYRQRLEDRGVSVEEQVGDHPRQAAVGLAAGIVVSGLILCVAECAPAAAFMLTRGAPVVSAVMETPAIPGSVGLVVTTQKLQQLADDALNAVGPGRGPQHGTAVHTQFANGIRALGDPAISAEQSYLNGRLVDYGTKGSVRIDSVAGNPANPNAAFDLKTGNATLTQGRTDQFRQHLPESCEIIGCIKPN